MKGVNFKGYMPSLLPAGALSAYSSASHENQLPQSCHHKPGSFSHHAFSNMMDCVSSEARAKVNPSSLLRCFCQAFGHNHIKITNIEKNGTRSGVVVMIRPCGSKVFGIGLRTNVKEFEALRKKIPSCYKQRLVGHSGGSEED